MNINKNPEWLKPYIQNKNFVSSIILASLDAADPTEAVSRNLDFSNDCLRIGENEYQFSPSSKLILVGLGKAAPAMINGAIEVLKEWITQGICVCKHLPDKTPSNLQITSIVGNHPVPGEGSLRGGKAIQEAVKGLTQNDLVLLLLSGGGSSLASIPAGSVTLSDMQVLTETLLRSGATINEMNAVRKHLDGFKGGGFLRMASPARVASLILSDVVGSPLSVIASGPTVPDPTTYEQALEIVTRASRFGSIPQSIREYLEKGNRGEVVETVKRDEAAAYNFSNTIIGSNLVSCRAAIDAAGRMGIDAEMVTTELIGEARLAGKYLAEQALAHSSDPGPFVKIFGGETTVTINGNGIGGRNLEVALGAVKDFSGMEDMMLVTLATDGEDGPTDAAGAVVTGDTYSKALSLGLDPDFYLNNNDSYSFFEKVGGLLKPGPTGTNVNDINFIFKL